MLFKISLLALAVASFVSATPRQYNDFQISTGVGGNASAEAISEFPGALDSLTGTAESDVNTEAHCAVLAEAAYISAEAAAGASTAAGKAVAVGLIKNKVLKIYSTLQALTSQVAVSGNTSTTVASLEDLTTKLAANIKIDLGNAGMASTAVSFTCP